MPPSQLIIIKSNPLFMEISPFFQKIDTSELFLDAKRNHIYINTYN
jgi:hypothetical protein